MSTTLLAKDVLMRMFGRINETSACPKHGGQQLAACPRCDVVVCRGCTDQCGCDKPAPPKAVVLDAVPFMRAMSYKRNVKKVDMRRKENKVS